MQEFLVCCHYSLAWMVNDTDLISRFQESWKWIRNRSNLFPNICKIAAILKFWLPRGLFISNSMSESCTYLWRNRLPEYSSVFIVIKMYHAFMFFCLVMNVKAVVKLFSYTSYHIKCIILNTWYDLHCFLQASRFVRAFMLVITKHLVLE